MGATALNLLALCPADDAEWMFGNSRFHPVLDLDGGFLMDDE
jgi:hypothetical protein